MQSKILVVKFITLAALVLGIFGVDSSMPAAAETCGKCDAVLNKDGKVVGHMCVGVAGSTHRCSATVDGCDFPEGKCDPPMGD
jgi:hypothetical protein